MSDWGKLIFYYDYESMDIFEETMNIAGVICKDYKYPGVDGMIMHAYYGMTYFLERAKRDHFNFHFVGINDDRSDYWTLNAAFDTLFDYYTIVPGGNALNDIIKYKNKNTEQFENYAHRLLFNSEGMYGWLYIYYTGDLKTGKKFKYGYLYGHGEEFKLGDVRRAFDMAGAETLDEEDLQLIEKMIEFFEEKGELMTEEEFEAFEDKCLVWTIDAAKRMEVFESDIEEM